MFSRILLGLLIADSLILIAVVLLQAGKGGGLAASFGGVTSSSDAILGTRQAGNILTKMSWWCGGLFLAFAFLLSLSSSQQSAPRSILDQTFSPQPIQTPATQPNTPASNILPVQPAPTGDTKTPAPAPTKTP